MRGGAIRRSAVVRGAIPTAGVAAVLAASRIWAASTTSILPPPAGSDARVAQAVAAVREERLLADVERLAAFGTRHTYSGTASARVGIGAARLWIAEELRRASPRMRVVMDSYRLPPQGGRLLREVELVNVVGMLPGHGPGSDRRILVSGHYDSVAKGPDGAFHWDQGDLPAPGANDDGSGTAAVLELARALSPLEMEATVVFIAFAGEEQGLVGSSLYAARAAREKEPIEAVLNNDIVGNEVGGGGRAQNTRVHLYSSGPEDSPSRELARYVEWFGELYVPAMDVRPIFRSDRFGRGGDHTPFEQRGFAAVRFTVAEEDYARQHDVRDTPDGVSGRYLAAVTRVNAAVLASLALAPPRPVVNDERGQPRLDRGDSGYDARLRWEMPTAPPDLAGFEILARETNSPRWERSWTVPAEVREFTLPGVSIDTVTLAVRSLDRDGNRSLAAAYVLPARPVAEYLTLP